MDEFENLCDDFPFLRGVDLTLWLQLLVATVVLAVVAVAALG